MACQMSVDRRLSYHAAVVEWVYLPVLRARIDSMIANSIRLTLTKPRIPACSLSIKCQSIKNLSDQIVAGDCGETGPWANRIGTTRDCTIYILIRIRWSMVWLWIVPLVVVCTDRFEGGNCRMTSFCHSDPEGAG